MSEPVADHVPPLPPLEPDRLDVDATAAQAVDLDAGPGEPAPEPLTRAERRAQAEAPEPLTRAERRAQAEAASSGRRRASAQESSVLDHPAVLVALSVLTLVAVVVGIDQASQGTVVALVPAVLLVVAYVVVVRRRRR
jgi:Flp pilus assembly protein TadB